MNEFYEKLLEQLTQLIDAPTSRDSESSVKSSPDKSPDPSKQNTNQAKRHDLVVFIEEHKAKITDLLAETATAQTEQIEMQRDELKKSINTIVSEQEISESLKNAM